MLQKGTLSGMFSFTQIPLLCLSRSYLVKKIKHTKTTNIHRLRIFFYMKIRIELKLFSLVDLKSCYNNRNFSLYGQIYKLIGHRTC